MSIETNSMNPLYTAGGKRQFGIWPNRKYGESTVILLLITLLCTCASRASCATGDANILTISPDICVRGERQSRCHVDLTIRVSLPESQGYCISAPSIQYYRCVNEGGEVTEIRRVAIMEGLEIRIETLDGLRTIARKELSVADFYPTHPQPRKNLGWILM